MTETEEATVTRLVADVSPAASRESLLERFGDLRLDLDLELGTARVRLGEILALGTGRRLHVRRAAPLDLAFAIDGRRLLTGALLERDGRLAVRVLRRVEES